MNAANTPQPPGVSTSGNTIEMPKPKPTGQHVQLKQKILETIIVQDIEGGESTRRRINKSSFNPATMRNLTAEAEEAEANRLAKVAEEQRKAETTTAPDPDPDPDEDEEDEDEDDDEVDDKPAAGVKKRSTKKKTTKKS